MQECLFLYIRTHAWCSLDTTDVYGFSIWKLLCNNVPSYAGHKANPTEIYRQTWENGSGLQHKTCFFRFGVNQNIRNKKIISAFTQVDSPLLSVVQTALCYTMYLLPTQLQEAPPSLHHQQHNTSRSEFSHLRLPAPHNINISHVCFQVKFQISTALQARQTVWVQWVVIKYTHLTSSGWVM